MGEMGTKGAEGVCRRNGSCTKSIRTRSDIGVTQICAEVSEILRGEVGEIRRPGLGYRLPET